MATVLAGNANTMFADVVAVFILYNVMNYLALYSSSSLRQCVDVAEDLKKIEFLLAIAEGGCGQTAFEQFSYDPELSLIMSDEVDD